MNWDCLIKQFLAASLAMGLIVILASAGIFILRKTEDKGALQPVALALYFIAVFTMIGYAAECL